MKRLICKIFGHKEYEMFRVSFDSWDIIRSIDKSCLRCGKRLTNS